LTLAKARYVVIACHNFRAELGHGESYRTRAIVCEALANAGFTVATPTNGEPHVLDHVHAYRGDSSPIKLARVSV
jgi:hypothetical protein